MDRRVEPDGPSSCDLAVVGESPGREEVELGRGFVGPSGRLLWGGDYDLIGSIVGRPRDTVWVSNVCKVPMPEPEWLRLQDRDRQAWIAELTAELEVVQPKVVIAFGSRASGILAGVHYISREQGKPRWVGGAGGHIVLPMWHPAAYLRGNQQVLGDLAVGLALVPDLLKNGIKVEPSEVGLPATIDEYLGITIKNVAFLKRGKVRKTSRCRMCGAKPAVTYEASFCDTHAIATDQWFRDLK